MTRNVKCPNCGKVVLLSGNPNRPFCSERCKIIDLGAWADEKYSIPGGTVDENDLEVENK